MSSELLQQALAKIKAGQKKEARDLLLHLVDKNPEHEAAWLWLSKLVDEPVDQIIALENALSINPDRPKTRAHLEKLKKKYPHALQPTSTDLLTQAMQAAKIGRRSQAREILHKLVKDEPTNEDAWFRLSQLVDNVEEQITALENVLHLNPNHKLARTRLTQIEVGYEDFLALGRAYEEKGQMKKAVKAYNLAERRSPMATDRYIAEKRRRIIEKQVKRLRRVRIIDPTMQLIRLAIGPLLLFGLFMILQSGLNARYLSPLACLGGLAVLLGGIAAATAITHPYHPLWQQWLGVKKLPMTHRMIMTGIGLLILLTPFVIYILLAYNRLEALRNGSGT